MGRRLTPLEASFLDWEHASPSNHQHLDWGMLFDSLPGGGAPPIADVRQHLLQRLVHLPRFTQKVVPAKISAFVRPAWKSDLNFDITAHVSEETLPSPGSEDALLDWLSRYTPRRLSRTRPLWEITLLTGLEDERWALAVKAHHSLLDGLGGAAFAETLLDTAPGSLPQRPARTKVPRPGSPSGGPRAVITGLAVLREMLSERDASPAPQTSLNVPIGPARKLAFVELPLDRLQRIRHQLGGTLNDVVLAASSGGLRALFEHREELPLVDCIHTMVPVNTKVGNQPEVNQVRVSTLRLALPLAEPDPLRRYLSIVSASTAAKESDQAARLEKLLALGELLPPFLQKAVERTLFTPNHHSLTISNIPGPPTTLYVMGAPMRRVLPVMPISTGRAVGIAAVSYAGTMIFALAADPRSVADLPVLTSGIEASVAELIAIAG